MGMRNFWVCGMLAFLLAGAGAQEDANLPAAEGPPLLPPDFNAPPFYPSLDFGLQMVLQAKGEGKDLGQVARDLGIEMEGSKVHVSVVAGKETELEGLEGFSLEKEEIQETVKQGEGWIEMEKLAGFALTPGILFVTPYFTPPAPPDEAFKQKAEAVLQELVKEKKEQGNLEAFAEKNGLLVSLGQVKVRVQVEEGIDLVQAFPGFEQESAEGLSAGMVQGNIAIAKLEELSSLPQVKKIEAVKTEGKETGAPGEENPAGETGSTEAETKAAPNPLLEWGPPGLMVLGIVLIGAYFLRRKYRGN